MSNLIYLIPFIAAFIGWSISWGITYFLFQPTSPTLFFGIKVQGVFPKNQQFIAKQIAVLVSKEIFSLDELNSKIASPSSIEKIIPFIDEKVDHFLRVKLTAKMPMISMFIGEATMAELKSVFMEELQELFPELMKHYTSGVFADIQLENLIESKILNIKSSQVEQAFKLLFANKLRAFVLTGTAFGFIIGLLQLLIALLSR